MRNLALSLSFAAAAATAQTVPRPATPPLIVVEDRGGTSALPYYAAAKLPVLEPSPPNSVPAAPQRSVTETFVLPLRPALLTVGTAERRALALPGMRPFFLVGDDAKSRAWLAQRARQLRALQAVGLVVQVETAAGLASLRALVPGVPLVPAAGDDIARRLALRHYPVLVTATGVEP